MPIPKLIVQLPLPDGRGTDAEVAARDELAAALADGFRAHGYGRFRGTQDGVGRTNLVFAERDSDLDTLPVEYIRAELRARGLLDAAVIAYEVRSAGRGGTRRPRYEVVWPAGYAGEFDPG